MKKSVIFAAAIFILSIHSLSAEETARVDAVPAAIQGSPANTFGLTVTGDGKLIVRPGRVFTEGGDYSGMILPYLLSNPKPIPYPRWAVRQGWQGRFVIAIEVLVNGSVGRFKVMKSTGHTLLDESATNAVRIWKFSPAAKNGKPVVTCIQIPVVFQLDSGN